MAQTVEDGSLDERIRAGGHLHVHGRGRVGAAVGIRHGHGIHALGVYRKRVGAAAVRPQVDEAACRGREGEHAAFTKRCRVGRRNGSAEWIGRHGQVVRGGGGTAAVIGSCSRHRVGACGKCVVCRAAGAGILAAGSGVAEVPRQVLAGSGKFQCVAGAGLPGRHNHGRNRLGYVRKFGSGRRAAAVGRHGQRHGIRSAGGVAVCRVLNIRRVGCAGSRVVEVPVPGGNAAAGQKRTAFVEAGGVSGAGRQRYKLCYCFHVYRINHPADSSRGERGHQGNNVAACSWENKRHLITGSTPVDTLTRLPENPLRRACQIIGANGSKLKRIAAGRGQNLNGNTAWRATRATAGEATAATATAVGNDGNGAGNCRAARCIRGLYGVTAVLVGRVGGGIHAERIAVLKPLVREVAGRVGQGNHIYRHGIVAESRGVGGGNGQIWPLGSKNRERAAAGAAIGVGHGNNVVPRPQINRSGSAEYGAGGAFPGIGGERNGRLHGGGNSRTQAVRMQHGRRQVWRHVHNLIHRLAAGRNGDGVCAGVLPVNFHGVAALTRYDGACVGRLQTPLKIQAGDVRSCVGGRAADTNLRRSGDGNAADGLRFQINYCRRTAEAVGGKCRCPQLVRANWPPGDIQRVTHDDRWRAGAVAHHPADACTGSSAVGGVGKRLARTNDQWPVNGGRAGGRSRYTDGPFGAIRTGEQRIVRLGKHAVDARPGGKRRCHGCSGRGGSPGYRTVGRRERPVAAEVRVVEREAGKEISGCSDASLHRAVGMKRGHDAHRNGVLPAATEVAVVVTHRKPKGRGRIREIVPVNGHAVGALPVHNSSAAAQRPHEAGTAIRLDKIHLLRIGAHTLGALYFGIVVNDRYPNDCRERARASGANEVAEGNVARGAGCPLHGDAVRTGSTAVEHGTVGAYRPVDAGTIGRGGVGVGSARTHVADAVEHGRFCVEHFDDRFRGIGAKTGAYGYQPHGVQSGVGVGVLRVHGVRRGKIVAEKPLVGIGLLASVVEPHRLPLAYAQRIHACGMRRIRVEQRPGFVHDGYAQAVFADALVCSGAAASGDDHHRNRS